MKNSQPPTIFTDSYKKRVYFIFFLSVVDCTFYKIAIKSNCILLLCNV